MALDGTNDYEISAKKCCDDLELVRTRDQKRCSFDVRG
jgi:hypothetical protein